MSFMRTIDPAFKVPTGQTLVRCVAPSPDDHGRPCSFYEHDSGALRYQSTRTGQTERRISWREAIFHMPVCHGLPMVTLGGWRQQLVIDAITRHGLPLGPCDLSAGAGGAEWCRSHDWHRGGSWSEELLRDGRCPHAPIAALFDRRHALAVRDYGWV